MSDWIERVTGVGWNPTNRRSGCCKAQVLARHFPRYIELRCSACGKTRSVR